MRIFVVADDLTGANDTAVHFAKVGLATATLLAAEDLGALGSFDVFARSTGSRGLPGREAYDLAQQVTLALGADAGDLIYKKIDSALRGNLAAEIEGVLDALPGAHAAVVAPAYPKNGRTTVAGCQLIGGVPVSETEMANDPVAPVREAHIPTLLRRLSQARVAEIGLAEIEKGAAHVSGELERLARAGCRFIVCDAISDRDLESVARAALAVQGAVPCGSAGLAEALARVLAEGRPIGGERPDDREPGRSRPYGPLFGVVGSKSRVAKAQVERLRAETVRVACLELPPEDLADATGEGDAFRRRVADRIAASLRGGNHVVVYAGEGSSAVPGGVAPERIVATLGALVRDVLASTRVGTIYLTGGDTAEAALRALGTQALELLGEVEPGIVLGRLLGGAGAGVFTVTKAGSFGDAGVLVRIAQRLRAVRRGGVPGTPP